MSKLPLSTQQGSNPDGLEYIRERTVSVGLVHAVRVAFNTENTAVCRKSRTRLSQKARSLSMLGVSAARTHERGWCEAVPAPSRYWTITDVNNRQAASFSLASP